MISQTIKSGDWKGEKHVPVIECPDTFKAGEEIEVKVSVGKEIPHPNTDKHHITWIKLFFQAEGKPPFEIGTIEFNAHDEDHKLFSSYKGTIYFTAESAGKIQAVSFCNIHGLWENEKEIKLA